MEADKEMQAEAASILQTRMDKCTQEQFWAVAAQSAVSAFAFSQRKEMIEMFSFFPLALLLFASAWYAALFILHRHRMYYVYRTELARLVTLAGIDGLLARRPSQKAFYALSGTTFYIGAVAVVTFAAIRSISPDGLPSLYRVSAFFFAIAFFVATIKEGVALATGESPDHSPSGLRWLGFAAGFVLSLLVGLNTWFEMKTSPFNDEGEKMLQEAWTLVGIPFVSGGIAGFLAQNWADRLKLSRTSGLLNVTVEPDVPGACRFRVENGSGYTTENAAGYLTLNLDKQNDLLDDYCFITPGGHPKDIYFDCLCWADATPSGFNPPKIDIYPGEKQGLNIAWFGSDRIVIPSEQGYPDKGKDRKGRAALKNKVYRAFLSIVAKNMLRRTFEIEINPAVAGSEKVKILRAIPMRWKWWKLWQGPSSDLIPSP